MQVKDVRGASLSLQQNHLWSFLQGNAVYCVQGAIWLQGNVDGTIFQQAMHRMVEQHEVVQTLFHKIAGMDVPIQVIGRCPPLHCPIVNLERFSPSVQHALLDASYEALQTAQFDLVHGPIVLSTLFRLTDEKHLFLVCLPTLCADASTLPLFVAALVRSYEACLHNNSLEEEPLQYGDVSAWQDELRELEGAKIPHDFWNKIDLLQARQTHLPFGLDASLSLVQKSRFEPRCLSVAVDEKHVSSLFELAAAYNVQVSALLLACWQVTLWGVLDETRFVMGVACDGRDQEDLANVLGPYTRFVPVGLSFGEHWTFAQVVASVNQSLQDAIRWQSYFTWDNQDEQDGSQYFSIAFEHQTWPEIIRGGSLAASLYRSSNCIEPFTIKLRVLQVAKHFQLELHYDPCWFSRERADYLCATLRALLNSVLECPQTRIRDLPLLDSAERARLIKLFQAPKRALSTPGFHQLFEEQAGKIPHQLALLSTDEQLTYQELNSRANQLARALRRRGVGPGAPVGLCFPRSVQMIVAMLAIFKVGGAYVPFDPDHPSARLAYQLQDVQPLLLLTEHEFLAHLPPFNGHVVAMKTLYSEAVQEDTCNLSLPCEPENLAYVIYTSGSTGAPKGVMVRQGSIVNYTHALCELLKPEVGWHFATVSTLAADLGNTAIFCALASGGCLQILDYAIVTATEAFARWGELHPIDVLKIVPSHLSALLIGEHASGVLPRKALLLGGEGLSVALVERVREHGATCVVYNHYGPTETTIGVLVNTLQMLDHNKISGEDTRKALTIPLGRPIVNVDVYVLNTSLHIVPVGVTGELYIGGAALAEGYLHQPEQTAERFVPHPFSGQSGDRLYRTGDLVRYSEQGQIEFVGRRDGQVKLRGYRIELGEIEAILRQQHNVWDCAVALRDDVGGNPQLVGYVVARKQPDPTPEELRDFLCKHVPEYMLPSLFVALKVLPLTTNGKVDRRQLPKPEMSLKEARFIRAMPRDPFEEMLLAIWKDLLALPEIDIHANFFQLGGHSLLVTQVISRVRVAMQVELLIQSLFEHPTIAGLARQVEYLVRGEQVEQMLPLLPADRSIVLPLSFAQQRLWFLDQLEPGGTAYLIPRARRIHGALDVAVLERSLGEIVRRHEALRTTFQEQAGQPVQVIHPMGTFRFPVVDLRGLTPEEREHEARLLANQEARYPCNLKAGPLLRTYLLLLNAQDCVFLLTMHHIISDGWSNDVFNRELTALYQAFVAGKLSPLPKLPIQYADFALWQRQRLQGDAFDAQLAYWREQLAEITPLELPADRLRPPTKTYQGAFVSVQLPVTLREELAVLGQREEVTLFMLLLGAFQVLLMRYTGQSDISVGTPIANRTHGELEDLIGFFVNTLVLRTDLAGNPPFVEALRRVREVALQAYAHQDIPFERLVDILQPQRDLSRTPLFQVMFTMQQIAENTESLQGLTISGLSTSHTTAKFDLTLTISNGAQDWFCDVEYNTDIFEENTIRRLLEHWQTLLWGIVAAPQTPLLDLPLLPEVERHLLLTEWNTLQAGEQLLEPCLHTRFEKQAACTPDAVALVCEDVCLTYNHVNTRANQLAHTLQAQDIGPEAIVGVALERSLLLCIALLGVLKAGSAYVPLDPSYPPERLAFMLTDARVVVLLTQRSLIESLPTCDVPVICLDSAWPSVARAAKHNPQSMVTAENLAYIIYTSGSTGTPKGVMVTHANVMRLFTSTQQWFHFHSKDVWTLFHSYAFDFSVWEMWGALLYGGRLIVVPYVVSRSPEVFYSLLALQGVTVLNQTPSAFRQLMQAEASLQEAQPMALRQVIFGGEALDVRSLRPWFEKHGEQEPQLVNMYGITETTVHVTYRPLCLQDTERAVGSMIGRPLPDLQVYVLDQQWQPVPIGIPGELYVGGYGLARGYLHRPTLTSERFIAHPFSSQTGVRLYRTGDQVRFLPDGDLEYLGRVDQQVKIRGFRIELGEIEMLLGQYPRIQECVVMAREDQPGARRLVAYVVAKRDNTLTGSELRTFLLGKLPDYMVPALFVRLEKLPLTTNGKVNRHVLPVPDRYRLELEDTYVAPRTPIEEILVGIWASALEIDQVGIHDNFFALGGDSIRSIKVLAQARQRGVYLSLRDLFEQQTIAKLSRVLNQEEMEQHWEGQEQQVNLITPEDWDQLPAEVEDAYPLVRLQVGMLFHSQYDPASAIYHDLMSYHLQAPLDVSYLHAVLQELAALHPILRTTFDLRSFSQPLQLVHREVAIPLQVEDWRDLSSLQQETLLADWMEEEKKHPFDWTQAPLLRVQIHRRSEHTFQFTLSFHHAILDGWSVASFLTDLFKRYLARLEEGREWLVEEPLITQFRAFVALEQKVLHSPEAQRFWQHKLSESTALILPRWEKSDPGTKRTTVHILRVPISPELSACLKSLARALAVPIKSVLLAAHLRVLSVLCGQTDILTGLAWNGRPETPDGERVLGLFLNTLPLRLKLAGGTWNDLVKETFAAECEMLPYRWYPLAEIQKQQGGQQLFETGFNFMHFHVYQGLAEAKNLSVLDYKGFEKTNFALSASFYQDVTSSQLGLVVHSDSAELCPEQIELIAGYYTTALHALAYAPQGRYDVQSLLSLQERQHLLVDCNATAVPSSQRWCIHELIEQQVVRTPDAVALCNEWQHLSYRELDRRANQLAQYLQVLGVEPGVSVGVYIERSFELIIVLLGILKAGGTYVPLDPSSPPERLAWMLTDIRPLVVISLHVSIMLPVLTEGTQICLEQIWPLLAHYPAQTAVNHVQPEHIAYVIYTSGSTGTPKGVQVTHRGLSNLALAQARAFMIDEQSRLLSFVALNFDVAVGEIVTTLLAGACLCLAPQERLLPGPGLVALLRQWAITVLQTTPAPLAALPGESVITLTTLVVGGESCPPEVAQRWAASRQLFNAYGPTETTVCASLGVWRPDAEQPGIGSPIAHTQMYVLDAFLQLVPLEVVGELYIGGSGLAQGYLNRPEITSERFIPHPFSHRPGERLYKTGDRVRRHRDGSLEFVGRLDQQVKLRGYRIELGEIEVVLAQHPAVREAVVLLQGDAATRGQLVGYIVSEPGSEQITSGELCEYLQAKLPPYMLPTAFVFLETFPQTSSGKTDRRALPAPEEQPGEKLEQKIVARTMLEELLVGIWSEVLGRAQANVGVQDNFFELGGHSLLAMQLISRVRSVLEIEVPLRSLFEHPTIAELAQSIEQVVREKQGIQIPPLVAVRRTQVLPLSFAQQRLWFLDQLEPGSTAYLMPSARKLQGALDVCALECSLQELVQRHETLRTTFSLYDGQPVQIIHQISTFCLPVVDLQGLLLEEREQEAQRLVSQEAELPYDLARGPLLYVSLLRLEREQHMLLLSMHHIISDGLSMRIVAKELYTLYSSFSTGQPSPLVPLPIQYADFAVWQRQWLQGAILDAQLAYWMRQLADVPPLELPTDYRRPAVQTYHGASETIQIAARLYDGLMALSRQEGATLFMTLLAAFQVLLARYSGQSDISVGSPIANRTHAELEDLIGFFVNTLVMRTDVSGNPSFIQVLKRVREVALGAYTHQDISFEYLVEALQPKRDLSRSPFFQVVFVLQNAPGLNVSARVEQSFVQTQNVVIERHTAPSELRMVVIENGHGLNVILEYNTDLFNEVTITRWLSHWQHLLEEIVADPERRILELPLLTSAERNQMLMEWNATHTDTPLDSCLHTLFEAQTARTPERVAVVCQEEQFTYAELNRRANQLARHLKAYGVDLEVSVGVCLERSFSLLVSILGILKAGGTYIPLDPTYPQERLTYMLGDAQLTVVLTSRQMQSVLPLHAATIVCLDDEWETIVRNEPTDLPCAVQAHNGAYIIYTSGSTGVPKGVLVTHRGLGNLAQAQGDLFGVHAGSRVMQFASSSFDASIAEIVVTLLAGATLLLEPHSRLLPGPDLITWLDEHAITTVTLPPPVLAVLPVEPLPALETLVVAGEACRADLVARWRPLCRMLNAYGPTEATVCASVGVCDSDQQPAIGRPISNVQIYLLDQYCEPVPVGIPGEIYIGGIGLARGYVQQSGQTAEHFVPHPFSMQEGERLYRTGDLGRCRPDGRIDFLGRLDQQVKVRGYRIEPAEIETLLLQHPDVKECVLIAREDKQGDRQLVAYIVANEVSTFAEGAVRVYLQGKLPDYMLPSLIVLVATLPLTPNGKVDRQALLAPELAVSAFDASYIPPTNTMEHIVAGIWQKVLDLEQVGIHENFFDLGGHSLLLAGVRVGLQEMLNRDVAVVDLFHYPTISSLAEYLDQQEDKTLALQPVQDQAKKRKDAIKRQQQRMQKVQEDQ